ncbi:MAG: hypothetical protein J0L92_02590 [Deltaproteobacteria bacterium]|nr:hypothetical protein [Deltaproteobacteria bacterium]
MVARALIANGFRAIATLVVIALASITAPRALRADARIVLRAPTCAARHMDLALLDELVVLELDDAAGDAIEIEIGNAICDASATSVDIVVRERTSGRERRDQIELVLDPDPAAHTRTVALAIAERAHLHLERRAIPVRVDADPLPPPAIETTIEPDASTLPAPRRIDPHAREDLSAPFAPEGYVHVAQRPPAPTFVSRATTLSIANELFVRVVPVHPSWAIGTRARARAYLDSTLWLEGGLLATWSRASVSNEGDVDAVVGAGTGALGLSLFREPWMLLSAAARVELGALLAAGSARFGIGGSTSVHPWATAGLAADVALPITPELSLVGDLGASAIVLGTRVSTTTGTQIDLSYFTLDVSIGLRAVVL